MLFSARICSCSRDTHTFAIAIACIALAKASDFGCYRRRHGLRYARTAAAASSMPFCSPLPSLGYAACCCCHTHFSYPMETTIGGGDDAQSGHTQMVLTQRVKAIHNWSMTTTTTMTMAAAIAADVEVGKKSAPAAAANATIHANQQQHQGDDAH